MLGELLHHPQRLHDALLAARLMLGPDGPALFDFVPAEGAAPAGPRITLVARVGLDPLAAEVAAEPSAGPRLRRALALTLIAGKSAIFSPREGATPAEHLAVTFAVDEAGAPWLVEVAPSAPSPAAFVPLLPAPDTAPLLAAFAAPRAVDVRAFTAAGAPVPAIVLEPDEVAVRPTPGGVALLDGIGGRLRHLDGDAASLFLALAEGCPVGELAAEARAARGEPGEAAVWDLASAWLHAGLLRRRGAPGLLPGPLDGPLALLPGATLASDGGSLLCHGEADEVALPTAGAHTVAFPVAEELKSWTPLSIGEGLDRLRAQGFSAAPDLGAARARQLLDWLLGLRYLEVPIAGHKEAHERHTAGEIRTCLGRLADCFTRHRLWFSLAYGTLLGAVRDGDVIPWDYDFDLLVRADEVPRLLGLAEELAEDEIVLIPQRIPGSHLALNQRRVPFFDNSAIAIRFRGRKLGDLYAFSLFSDGIMRRFDFVNDVYWCPHSSFPAFFVEGRSEVRLGDRTYPAVQHPERWIAGIYGEDWRVPYRAVKQGGQPRAGTTIHGDRYEPKLAEEIAWCVAQGWDRSRYGDAHAWPRPIAGAGPIGPTPRTAANSRSLWWRDLDELVRYF